MPNNQNATRRYLQFRLSHANKAELIGLIEELLDASEANETLVRARIKSYYRQDTLLENYRDRLVRCFSQNPKSSIELKLNKARRQIADYQKADGHFEGVLDLMLTYVETGTQFVISQEDINDSFYISLEVTFSDFANLLLTSANGIQAYVQFQDRLNQLAIRPHSTKIEYANFLQDQVAMLDEWFGQLVEP